MVKVEGQRLFLTNKEGTEHSAEVASDARVTLNGKAIRLDELKSGTTIKVKVRKNEGSPVILEVTATTR